MSYTAMRICQVLAFFWGMLLLWAWVSPADSPHPWGWPMHIIFFALLIMAAAPLIWLRFQTDKAPDFLRECGEKCWERGGFCFSIEPVVWEGTCYLHVRFQNRYSRRSEALIVLTCGLAPLAAIPLACDGGGFGSAWAPFGVPEDVQGGSLKTELWAGVRYPEGRGSLLRFRGGSDVARLQRSARAVSINDKVVRYANLDPRGGFGGSNTHVLELPRGVPASIPAGWPVFSEMQWRPGDGPELMEPENPPAAHRLLFENVALTAAWWLAGNQVAVEDESTNEEPAPQAT